MGGRSRGRPGLGQAGKFKNKDEEGNDGAPAGTHLLILKLWVTTSLWGAILKWPLSSSPPWPLKISCDGNVPWSATCLSGPPGALTRNKCLEHHPSPGMLIVNSRQCQFQFQAAIQLFWGWHLHQPGIFQNFYEITTQRKVVCLLSSKILQELLYFFSLWKTSSDHC